MSRYSLKNRHLLLFLSDLIIIITTAILSYYLINNHINIGVNDQIIVLINTLIILLASSINRLYSSSHQIVITRYIYQIFSTWLFSFICLLTLLFFSKQTSYFSMIWMKIWFTMGGSLTCIYRTLFVYLLNALGEQESSLKEIILLGNGKIIDDIDKMSQQHPEYGYHIDKIIALSSANNHQDIFHRLSTELKSQNDYELWICLPLSESYMIKKILYNLRHITVEIRFFPDLENIHLFNDKGTNLMGFHSLCLSCTAISADNLTIKRYEDIVLAMIILSIISLPCLLIMLMIKITSPGPILFKQQRHGINNRIFNIYKFRTMIVHKDKTMIIQATKHDTRTTKFGTFLRKTSLDELPQFINVLQGKMSIVGPRPHALSHNEYYKDLVTSYMWRHKVTPGITGWAQINGYRGETDTLYKMQKRVEHDLWYIEHWSLYLDLKIILITICKGFISKNSY
jgi:putative colanic acid biosynthesis UDP-glucose lipid carrier transferase